MEEVNVNQREKMLIEEEMEVTEVCSHGGGVSFPAKDFQEKGIKIFMEKDAIHVGQNII